MVDIQHFRPLGQLEDEYAQDSAETFDKETPALAANTKIESPNKNEKEINDLIKKHSLADKVVVPGFQTNPYPWIKYARLLVLSSRYEGFGNVLIEALALGTPVLSTDCGGPNEILSEGMLDCLVPNGELKPLAKKIHSFYSKPPHINSESLHRFDAIYIAKEYLKLIPKNYNF